MRRVYTIGHSSHPQEHFLALLQQHGIEVLVDTRSAPYSKYSPQFDRETLRDSLVAGGVKYLYLGSGWPACVRRSARTKPYYATSATGSQPGS